MEKTESKTTQGYGLSRYFLLTMTLSLLGWAFETTFVFVVTHRWTDRGFMTLPFCPIYGCSLVAAYFLVGTPDEGGLLLKKVENPVFRYPLYLLAAFVIPSLAELSVGFFFDKAFGIWLWSYAAQPFNLNGYVCLPISLAWAALIFFFMKFLFPPIKNALGKLPRAFVRIVAITLFIAVAIDLIYNFLLLFS
ncbi:MAG: putative ABC transporter permease [Clostridia bacterium]|nr:putative ABC transporter permease [Clostridia bacterium]